MSMNLILLVICGLGAAHVLSIIGDALINKGALLLDRDVLNRVLIRDARGSKVWVCGETIAVIVMVLGVLKAWGKISGKEPWGIPAVAIGFGLFCAANIARAWMRRVAFEAEAPGSKASKGALFAGLLTTVAELAVGIAVCGYIYTHMHHSSPSPSTPAPTTLNPTTPTQPGEQNQTQAYVSETEALALLPGKNAAYLKALADQKFIRVKSVNGATEYHRKDIVDQKYAGLPGAEELGLDQAKKDDTGTEKVEP